MASRRARATGSEPTERKTDVPRLGAFLADEPGGLGATRLAYAWRAPDRHPWVSMTSYAPPSAGEFVARLAEAPCCAAIVDAARLDAALSSRVPAIFVLRGNGLDLADMIGRVHDRGKLIAVHLDLVDGLKADHWGVSWLARSGVDAVITSHGQLMSVIRNEGATAIHRLLLSRREHLDTAVTALARSRPDIVEFLPGVILPAVAHLLPPLDIPILAGGFIRTPFDARALLEIGALAVTTSSEGLWDLDGR